MDKKITTFQSFRLPSAPKTEVTLTKTLNETFGVHSEEKLQQWNGNVRTFIL